MLHREMSAVMKVLEGSMNLSDKWIHWACQTCLYSRQWPEASKKLAQKRALAQNEKQWRRSQEETCSVGRGDSFLCDSKPVSVGPLNEQVKCRLKSGLWV